MIIKIKDKRKLNEKNQSTSFKQLPYLLFTKQENKITRSVILAKEEINLAIYVINQTNDLKDLDYMKNLKLEKIWTSFRKTLI